MPQQSASPILRVEIAFFKGAMNRIGYMRTKQVMYDDPNATQDLEPRYVFTRQDNGKYRGKMIEGAMIQSTFGKGEDNVKISDIVGEFTLDEVQKKIEAYKDPIVLSTFGTNNLGERAHYFICEHADQALKKMFNEARAINQVGDLALAVKFRAALDHDTDMVLRAKDAVGLYISAVDIEDRTRGWTNLTKELLEMRPTMTAIFANNPLLYTNIKNVIEEQIKGLNMIEAKYPKEWLDIVQKAEPTSTLPQPLPKMQQNVTMPRKG